MISERVVGAAAAAGKREWAQSGGWVARELSWIASISECRVGVTDVYCSFGACCEELATVSGVCVTFISHFGGVQL